LGRDEAIVVEVHDLEDQLEFGAHAGVEELLEELSEGQEVDALYLLFLVEVSIIFGWAAIGSGIISFAIMALGIVQGQLEQSLAQQQGQGVYILQEDHFVDAGLLPVLGKWGTLVSNLILLAVLGGAEFGLLGQVSEDVGEVGNENISDEGFVVFVVHPLQALTGLRLKEVVVLQNHLHVGEG
jgi:hypothetical protein